MKLNGMNVLKLACLVILLHILVACANQPSSDASQSDFTLQVPRYGHAAITDGKLIYVFGGANKDGFLSSVEIIDPATRKTKVLENAIIPRRYHAAVWDGQDKVYLLGGVANNAQRFRIPFEIEVFDINLLKVTNSLKHPFPTRFATSAFADNEIFVFGGAIPSRKV